MLGMPRKSPAFSGFESTDPVIAAEVVKAGEAAALSVVEIGADGCVQLIGGLVLIDSVGVEDDFSGDVGRGKALAGNVEVDVIAARSAGGRIASIISTTVPAALLAAL